MAKLTEGMIEKESKFLQQELKENPYRKFDIVFALMTVIPFLVFLYAIFKFFTLRILVGNVGLIFFLSLFLALCGYYLGYETIKKLFGKMIIYAAESRHRDQLKTEFVAFVSHELKTPLSIMRMHLTNLHLGLLGNVTQSQKEIVKVSQDMVGRMNQLITNMLDSYKLEMGMVKIEKTEFDFRETLEEQLKTFEILFNDKGINLSKNISSRPLTIFADKTLITQVVNNLLSNAKKFTPVEGSVNLSAYPTDEFARFEVKNTGPAIPFEMMPKIFDKFERIDANKEGAGLGLSITRDILEYHEGKIWAESKEGKGTTFIALLPLSRNQKGE